MSRLKRSPNNRPRLQQRTLQVLHLPTWGLLPHRPRPRLQPWNRFGTTQEMSRLRFLRKNRPQEQ